MSIKSNTPLVSVIIAAYNEEKYILECIDSIINQTYKNIEIIVINDGSTDNTLHLLRSYNDNRLEIFTHENRGRVFSRNRALHLAKGKYVILQDADDWSNEFRIEEMIAVAEKIKSNPVVGSNYYIFSDKKKELRYVSLRKNNNAIRQKMSRPILANSILPGGILVTTEQIKKLGGWRGKFKIAAEDGDLLDRLFEDGSHFFNIQKPLYYYRMNTGSVTNNYSKTLPYQIFKRYCKKQRRQNKSEPKDIEEYFEELNASLIKKISYNVEFFLFWILFNFLYK